MTLRLGVDLLLSPHSSQQCHNESVPGRPALASAYIHKMVIFILEQGGGIGCPALPACCPALPACCPACSLGGARVALLVWSNFENLFCKHSTGCCWIPFLAGEMEMIQNSSVASYCHIPASNSTQNKGFTMQRAMVAYGNLSNKAVNCICLQFCLTYESSIFCVLSLKPSNRLNLI